MTHTDLNQIENQSITNRYNVHSIIELHLDLIQLRNHYVIITS